MVYDVLGTASLMSGVPMASQRPVRAAAAQHSAPPAAAVRHLAGNPVHPARAQRRDVRDVVQGAMMAAGGGGAGAAGGGGGAGAGNAGLPPASGGVASTGSYNKGLYQEDRYIDRARREDFFFSLLHASPHATAMMAEIFTALHLDFRALQLETPNRCGPGTFGHFIFAELSCPVNIPAILDSIMLLKESTLQYEAETRGPGGHGPGWTFENHYGRCQIAEENRPGSAAAHAAIARAATAGTAVIDLPGDCLCCNSIANREGVRKCPICAPSRKRSCILGVGKDRDQPKAYIDAMVYSAADAPRSERVECVFNISGHLASLLAMHAYFNTDLLRPGNFAPLYNVSLTATYFSTLCRGLLLRQFSEASRGQLTRLLDMMVFHELWMKVDDKYLEAEPSTALMKTSGPRRFTNVLFDRPQVSWKRLPLAGHDLRGCVLQNQALFAKVQAGIAAVAAAPAAAVNIEWKQKIEEIHECGAWWLCAQDYFVDGLYVYAAYEDAVDNDANIIWVRKAIQLKVLKTVTQWKIHLTLAAMDPADRALYPTALSNMRTLINNVKRAIDKCMAARVEVLKNQQIPVNLAISDDDYYWHLLRDGYIVGTELDNAYNILDQQLPSTGHMHMDLGPVAVFITPFPPRSTLPPPTPDIIDETSRISRILGTTTLCVTRGLVHSRYRPFRWFVQHG